MAGVTGLEPATSGVTGRRSNQLSYTPAEAALREKPVGERAVVYCEPLGLSRKLRVLGAARYPQVLTKQGLAALVGGDGIEPPTSCV